MQRLHFRAVMGQVPSKFKPHCREGPLLSHGLRGSVQLCQICQVKVVPAQLLPGACDRMARGEH